MEKGTKREGKERGACEEKRERREWEKGDVERRLKKRRKKPVEREGRGDREKKRG